jgi:ATP phosphoribosyltransferase regulatory subunit HisZ
MPDQVKDFTYYAALAEQEARASKQAGIEAAKLSLGRAEIYARLAAAAPKHEPRDWPMRDNG